MPVVAFLDIIENGTNMLITITCSTNKINNS